MASAETSDSGKTGSSRRKQVGRQPGFPGYTRRRRLRPWLRALAVTCLAGTMIGGPSLVAGGITPGASALVHAPDEPCSVLSAEAAGPRFCLKADPGDQGVQLTWSPSTPAGSITVYEEQLPEGPSSPATVRNPTDKGASVVGLANGTRYAFWLADGETVVSDRVLATPESEPPAAPGTPGGLTAVPDDTKVTLTWDPPASDSGPPASDSGSPVSGYNVYQGTSPGGEASTPVNATPVTSPTYTVTGLTNGSTYYFTVKAVYIIESPVNSEPAINMVAQDVVEGQASCEVPAVPATVPGAPGRPAAVPGDRQVTLAWDPPGSTGGSPVSGYDVYLGTSPGGEASTPVNATPVTSPTYTATGLTNGSTYYFTVKAVNARGHGAASSEVPAVPFTVPGPPAGLTATAADAKVTLAWSPPASNGGSPVTSYDLYMGTTAQFARGTPVAPVTGTAVTVTGLANGTPYYFWVTAVNKAGESQPSPGVPAVPFTVPGAPAGLTATAADAKVTLAWSPPASNGGSPVTGYDLYVGTTAQFAQRTPFATVTGTAVTVTGLANGTTYYFRATAVNKAGQGPASDEVPVTPLTVPGAPRLTAIPGKSEVILAWSAPASGGAPISGYIIYQGTSPGGETGTPVSGGPVTGTSYTVTGLTSGTTYYFKMAAVNAAGLSPLSAEASARLPVAPSSPPPSSTPPGSTPPGSTPPGSTPPGSTPASGAARAITAPTGLTATAEDSQVHLSWTAPASDGGSPVVSYKIYIAMAPGVQEIPAAASARTTGVTVTHLRNQAVYYFMVTGVNAAGTESPPSTEVSAEPGGPVRGRTVSLNRPAVPPLLVALLAAIGAMAAAGALTLIGRSRLFRSRKGARPEHAAVASDVRAVPDTAPPDVSIRDTGTEPVHTLRIEPHPGVSVTTIKEGRP